MPVEARRTSLHPQGCLKNENVTGMTYKMRRLRTYSMLFFFLLVLYCFILIFIESHIITICPPFFAKLNIFKKSSEIPS